MRLVYRQTAHNHYLVLNDGIVVGHIYSEDGVWQIHNCYIQTGRPVMNERFESKHIRLAFHRAWDYLRKHAIGISWYYQWR